MSNEVVTKNGIKIEGNGILKQITTPSNPASGHNKYYTKADNKMYLLDSSGTETQVGSGSGGLMPITNTVVVDPAQTAVAGKIYNTYAAALVYVLTQTPTITNQWGILLPAGTFSEAIEVNSWVRVIGVKESTRLTGNITVNGLFIMSFFEYMIENCVIHGTIAVTGTNLGVDAQILTIYHCEVDGGVSNVSPQGLLVGYYSMFKGGDYTNTLLFNIINCLFVADISAITLSIGNVVADHTRFSSFGYNITFNGGEYTFCVLEGGNIINDGYYTFNHTDVSDNITLTTGNINAYFTNFNWNTVTVNTGTSITSYECVNLLVTKAGSPLGAWYNYGSTYDDSVTALGATNWQTAIAALASGAGANVTSELLVKTGVVNKPGVMYNSIGGALDYIDSYNTVVSNGLFESVPSTEWALTDCTLVAVMGTGHYNWYGQLTATGGTEQDISQIITVTPSVQHTLHFYVQSGTSGDEPFYAEINDGGTPYTVSGTSSAGWTKYDLTFTPTNSTVTLRMVKNSATIGTMHFDTIVVRNSSWEPSVTNQWSVKFNGYNMESFDVPPYVSIVGAGAATLAAPIGSADILSTYTARLVDCSVLSLNIASGGLVLNNCQVSGGTSTGGVLIIMNNSNVTGGNFSASSVMAFYSMFGACTLPSTCNMYHCYFEYGSGPTLSGGTFNECAFMTSASYGSGTYTFNGGRYANNITVSAGITLNLYNTEGNGNTVTVSGGSLTTKSVANTIITYSFGSWNNDGEVYDNRVSLLGGTTTQTAIDSLANRKMFDITINRADYAVGAGGDTAAGTALRNALSAGTYCSIFVKGDYTKGNIFDIGSTQLFIHGVVKRLEGEANSIAGSYNVIIKTSQTAGSTSGAGVFPLSFHNILVKNIQILCTGTLTANLRVFDIQNATNDSSVKYCFDNCSVNFTGTYGSYDCIGWYGDASASRYQIYNFFNINNCMAINCQGFYYTSGSMIGCRVQAVNGGGAIVYAYYSCRNMVNCTATEFTSGKPTIFYYSCYNINNCEVVSTGGTANAGQKIGFSACQRLTNCIVMDDRGVGYFSSTDDHVYGFDACENLKGCEVRMNLTASASNKNAIAFNACETLTGCRIDGTFLSVAIAISANTTNGIAAGFYNCRVLYGCFSSASLNGSLTYNSQFYNCDSATGCTADFVGTVSAACSGFRASNASSTLASTSSGVAGCKVNINTTTASVIIGFHSIEELSACEVQMIGADTTDIHIGFYECNGVNNCITNGYGASNLMANGFQNCSGVFGCHVTRSTTGYNTCEGWMNTEYNNTTGEATCTVLTWSSGTLYFSVNNNRDI